MIVAFSYFVSSISFSVIRATLQTFWFLQVNLYPTKRVFDRKHTSAGDTGNHGVCPRRRKGQHNSATQQPLSHCPSEILHTTEDEHAARSFRLYSTGRRTKQRRRRPPPLPLNLHNPPRPHQLREHAFFTKLMNLRDKRNPNAPQTILRSATSGTSRDFGKNDDD